MAVGAVLSHRSTGSRLKSDPDSYRDLKLSECLWLRFLSQGTRRPQGQ